MIWLLSIGKHFSNITEKRLFHEGKLLTTKHKKYVIQCIPEIRNQERAREVSDKAIRN